MTGWVSRGVGKRGSKGSKKKTNPFWRQISYIPYIKCKGRDQCKNSILENGSSHTKDVKNGSGPCLHGTHDEGGTTKHNWLAWCQYNVTG